MAQRKKFKDTDRYFFVPTAPYDSKVKGLKWFYGPYGTNHPKKALMHMETEIRILSFLGETHTVKDWRLMIADCIKSCRSFGTENPNATYHIQSGSRYFSNMVSYGFLVKV